jgi:hypothetical protein
MLLQNLFIVLLSDHVYCLQTVDNVLETVMCCDKLLATLPNVRWAEPVFGITSQLLEASIKFIANNFCSVLSSDRYVYCIWWRWRLCLINRMPTVNCKSEVDVWNTQYTHVSVLVCGWVHACTCLVFLDFGQSSCFDCMKCMVVSCTAVIAPCFYFEHTTSENHAS